MSFVKRSARALEADTEDIYMVVSLFAKFYLATVFSQAFLNEMETIVESDDENDDFDHGILARFGLADLLRFQIPICTTSLLNHLKISCSMAVPKIPCQW